MIALGIAVLEPARWKAVVDQVAERLLTPFGLRSLAPGDPDYKAIYTGDLRSRDAAYHQGTVWGWLIGPFIDARLRVYPAEIESVLQSHPGVKEVGVCGQADSQWGQVPVAFVVPRAGSTLNVEELLGYTAQKLARYKQPRAIHFTKRLPRTSSGKLLRRELTRLLQTPER